YDLCAQSAILILLFSCLNWGLGHATRSIPLIRRLEQMGERLLLASDGEALRLLRAEFPHLPSVELPAYGVRYPAGNMTLNILWQLPGMLLAMRREHALVQELVQKYAIRGIISDNRYGCYSEKVPSVLLTHQLNILPPHPLLSGPVQWANHRALRPFDALWVPDAAGSDNLSGGLSHGVSAHPHTCFIGLLSRMRRYDQPHLYDVAVVLSGPEPQRTYLERRLLAQAMAIPRRFLFVRGRTDTNQDDYPAGHIRVVSYLTARALNDALLSSELVVFRSVYSSLIDLAVFVKKALLIPTPGQTEQQYLAERMARAGIFAQQTQRNLHLAAGLDAAAQCSGLNPDDFKTNTFWKLLACWVADLPK
ncbi:MAG: hypothetical protein ACR2K1_07695, partial [Saprospiraceae bacterium]